MTKRSKAALLVLSLLLLWGTMRLLYSNQEGFTGSCVKNPDAYLLDIERMSGPRSIAETEGKPRTFL